MSKAKKLIKKNILWVLLLLFPLGINALELTFPPQSTFQFSILLVNGTGLWNNTAGYIYPTDSTFGLQIFSLANIGCLGTDSNGKLGSGICNNLTNAFGIVNYSTEYSSTGYKLANFTANLNTINDSISLWNISGSNIFPRTITNNVGIGTTSPSSLLQVGTTGNTEITIGNAGANAQGRLRFLSSNNQKNFQIGFNYNVVGGLEFTRSTAIGGSTFSTPDMTIDTNGNVGIGTTSPDRPLTLQRTTGNSDWLSFKNSAGTTKWHLTETNANDLDFTETGVANGRLYLKAGGNVGIGKTNPAYKLDVLGSTDIIHVNSTGAAAYYRATSTNSVSDWTFGAEDSSGSGFIVYDRVAGAYRINIKSNGNVGIGTTTPGSVLSVSGNLSTTTGALLATSSGNVGIGTTAPNEKLHVLGNARVGRNNVAGFLKLTSAADGSTHYNWLIGAQENVAAAVEITPSTATGGSTFTTPVAVFTQSGNVGIGTTAPLSKLDVNGGAAIGTYAGANAAPSNGLIVSGNVGIGTTAPTELLQIGAFENTGGARRAISLGGGGFGSPGNRTFISNGDKIILYNNSADFDARIGVDSVGGVWLKSLSTATTSQAYGSINFYTGQAAGLTAGTNRMIISGIGNVGINTTTPANTLTVQGTLNVTGNSSSSGDLFVMSSGNVGIAAKNPIALLQTQNRIEGTSLGSNVGLWVAGGNGVNRLAQIALGYSGDSVSRVPPAVIAWSAFDDSTFNGSIVFATANRQDFTTAPTERMRIDATGNVGIGTTGPTSPLQVKGTAAGVTGGLSLVQTSGSNVIAAMYEEQDLGVRYGTLDLRESSGGTTKIRLSADSNAGVVSYLNSGNVGIGTTSPLQALHVRSSNARLRVENTNTPNANITEFGVSSAAPSYGAGIWVNGTQQLHITDRGLALGSYVTSDPPSNGLIVSGNLGIGTTSPNFKEDVSGTINSSSIITNDASGAITTCNVGEIRGNATANKICLCTTINNWKCAAVS